MQAPQDRQPRAVFWRPCCFLPEVPLVLLKLTRMESGNFYNVSCKKKKDWSVLSELEMRHQVPLEARDMNGPLGLRPSSPLLDRWSWAWARDLPLRAWSGGRFFCREVLTSLIRLCPKLGLSVSSPVSPPWTRSRHGKRVTVDDSSGSTAVPAV